MPTTPAVLDGTGSHDVYSPTREIVINSKLFCLEKQKDFFYKLSLQKQPRGELDPLASGLGDLLAAYKDF